MTLRDLTLQELHHLHRHELREAFPPEELKPFAAMKKLYRAGVYHPVGAWEGETLVGYALLWEAPQRKYVLIDYLGVPAARRNGRSSSGCCGRSFGLGMGSSWSPRPRKGAKVMAYASGA